MLKLSALLICLTLTGAVVAAQVSQYLTWSMSVTDAEYALAFVVDPPTILSVLDSPSYSGEVVMSTSKAPTANYNFDVIFSLESIPAGATFADIDFGFSVGVTPASLVTMTGNSVTFSLVIPAGLTEITSDILLQINYPGDWQFSLVMDIP